MFETIAEACSFLDARRPLTFQEARNKLTEALAIVEKAANEYVATYGKSLQELNQIIRSNRSTWSGGAETKENIVEAIIRGRAQEEMNRMINRLPYQSV